MAQLKFKQMMARLDLRGVKMNMTRSLGLGAGVALIHV